MRTRAILASLFVAGALSLNFAAADAPQPASALAQSTDCGQHDGPLCSITRGCNIIFIPPFIFVPYCWEVVKYYPPPRPPDEETEEDELGG